MDTLTEKNIRQFIHKVRSWGCARVCSVLQSLSFLPRPDPLSPTLGDCVWLGCLCTPYRFLENYYGC